jgi:hypothetical protein
MASSADSTMSGFKDNSAPLPPRKRLAALFQITMAVETQAAPLNPESSVNAHVSAKAPPSVTDTVDTDAASVQIDLITSTSTGHREANGVALAAMPPSTQSIAVQTDDEVQLETLPVPSQASKGAIRKHPSYPNSQLAAGAPKILQDVAIANAAEPHSTPATNSALLMDMQFRAADLSWRKENHKGPERPIPASQRRASPRPPATTPSVALPYAVLELRHPSGKYYPRPTNMALVPRTPQPFTAEELLDRCADAVTTFRCSHCGEGSHTAATCSLRLLKRTPLQDQILKHIKVLNTTALSLKSLTGSELQRRGYESYQVAQHSRLSNTSRLMALRQGAFQPKLLARMHRGVTTFTHQEVAKPNNGGVNPPDIPAGMRRDHDTPESIQAYYATIRDAARAFNFSLNPSHPAARLPEPAVTALWPRAESPLTDEPQSDHLSPHASSLSLISSEEPSDWSILVCTKFFGLVFLFHLEPKFTIKLINSS